MGLEIDFICSEDGDEGDESGYDDYG